mgnify:FL=1
MENGNLRPVSVKVGDNVLLPEYGGSTLKLDNQELHVYRDDDIVGILDEPLKQWYIHIKHNTTYKIKIIYIRSRQFLFVDLF